MNLKHSSIAFTGLMLAGMAAWADPSVSINRVQQRYPWNGLVDIDYTVSGMESDSASYDLALTLKVGDEDVRLGHFLQCAGCDLPTAAGTHRVTWDSASDAIKVLDPAAVFKAKISVVKLTAATADFIIIDLSQGSAATSYPTRFGSGSDTSVFNVDAYKLDKLVLRRVSAGDYWIGTGNPVGDVSCKEKTSAIPSQRLRVRLTKDYFLGVFEVTQSQYERVTGLSPSSIKAKWKTGVLDDFRRPVEQVSFNTITTADTGFLALLSAKSKAEGAAVGTYRLPTEAQWEVAARSNVLTEFWWGNSAYYGVLMSRNMWRSSNSNLEEAPSVKGTHPVGFKPANPWGFYDILGNVSEWTQDLYVTPYSLYGGDGSLHAGTEADPVVDPCQTASGTVRMLRGGNWYGGGDYYTNYAGWRGDIKGTPTSSSDQWGFRVSMELP